MIDLRLREAIDRPAEDLANGPHVAARRAQLDAAAAAAAEIVEFEAWVGTPGSTRWLWWLAWTERAAGLFAAGVRGDATVNSHIHPNDRELDELWTLRRVAPSPPIPPGAHRGTSCPVAAALLAAGETAWASHHVICKLSGVAPGHFIPRAGVLNRVVAKRGWRARLVPAESVDWRSVLRGRLVAGVLSGRPPRESTGRHAVKFDGFDGNRLPGPAREAMPELAPLVAERLAVEQPLRQDREAA